LYMIQKVPLFTSTVTRRVINTVRSARSTCQHSHSFQRYKYFYCRRNLVCTFPSIYLCRLVLLNLVLRIQTQTRGQQQWRATLADHSPLLSTVRACQTHSWSYPPCLHHDMSSLSQKSPLKHVAQYNFAEPSLFVREPCVHPSRFFCCHESCP
jgi:hypothetical protein